MTFQHSVQATESNRFFDTMATTHQNVRHAIPPVKHTEFPLKLLFPT